MEVTLGSDSTSLSYWLRWEFFLCLLSVLTSMIIASILIWRYEGSSNTERAYSLYDAEAWMPCLKGLSPVWLMAFRIIASCLLLAASVADVATHGTNLFYYYTQWTLILTIFYFLFGSVLSTCGCMRQHKICNAHSKYTDVEKVLYVPLTKAGTGEVVNELEECYFSHTGAFWGYIFQILYQMTVGAVMLTDSVYWLLIFPFLTIVDYELSFVAIPISKHIRALRSNVVLGGRGFASSMLCCVCTVGENQVLYIVSVVSGVLPVFKMTSYDD